MYKNILLFSVKLKKIITAMKTDIIKKVKKLEKHKYNTWYKNRNTKKKNKISSDPDNAIEDKPSGC